MIQSDLLWLMFYRRTPNQRAEKSHFNSEKKHYFISLFELLSNAPVQLITKIFNRCVFRMQNDGRVVIRKLTFWFCVTKIKNFNDLIKYENGAGSHPH
jgi:hypothetical protein